MKKRDADYLKTLTLKDFERMGYEQCMKTVMGMLPEGSKFKSACMGDRDWWYVSKYINVQEPCDKERCLVVIRSWNKYKHRWIYKCEDVVSLLCCLHMDNEHC